jgi:alpha-mannosidase
MTDTLDSVNAAMSRLGGAADTAGAGWVPAKWTRVSGPGPDELAMRRVGMVFGPTCGFEGLVLEPGSELTLRLALQLPASIAGVPLAGDALEMTVNSLYPISLSCNGKTLLDEAIPLVAAGPALVTVLPSIADGTNGDLTIAIRTPNNQLSWDWNWLHFITPRLRHRFEILDLAHAQLMMASAVARSDQERDLLRQAAAAVPDDPLALDDAELERALEQVGERLMPLHDRAQKLKVHVINHSHIDLNWLWTWPDTVAVIKRDFRNVLAIMDDYPEMTFTHSQPATYEVIREQEPALFEMVLAHIKSGRWEPATMQWVESDTNIPSGEAMARQLLEGVRYSREVLGATPNIFFAPDTFGHAGNLPQLAAGAGALAYYHHRCNPGRVDDIIWPAYWWQGDDGTRLLGMSNPSYGGFITAGEIVRAAITLGLEKGLQSAVYFNGVIDHGGGPTRHSLDILRRLQGKPLIPQAKCSTVAAYAREVATDDNHLPVHVGESGTVFEGCYTTHTDTKLYNRGGENVLGTAETLSVVAGLDSRDELRDAWRKVLFNQFHDIIDGSAIHEVYEKNRSDFEEVAATAGAVLNRALDVLEAPVTPGAIAVTNPLSWQREDVVLVPSLTGSGPIRLVSDYGHETVGQYSAGGLCFIARVPAFATAAYSVRELEGGELEIDCVEDAAYYTVETPAFRARVRRDSGTLATFTDKGANRHLVSNTERPDLSLNVFQLLHEAPHGMSAWEMTDVQSETSVLGVASTTLLENGPVRLVLAVHHAVRDSVIDQQIVFYRDLPRVDFKTTVDWKEPGGPKIGLVDLKVSFTVSLPDNQAWFETPFAAAQRKSDGQEVPALCWADIGGEDYGFALLNDCKYGHDALGNRLRLSLVRNAYDPDRNSDLGIHNFTYSFVPHEGSWRDAGVVGAATGLNQPLIARVRQAQPPSPLANSLFRPTLAGDPSVVLSGLKREHAGPGLVMRLYESAGRPADVTLTNIPPGSHVFEASIVEDRGDEIASGDGGVSLAFKPWQVRTLVIEL